MKYLVLLLFSLNLWAIDKGVVFVNPPTAPLNKVNELSQIAVLSNLHIPKAVTVAILKDNVDFVLELYKIIYRINTDDHLMLAPHGYYQNIDLIVVGDQQQFKQKLEDSIGQQIDDSNALDYFKFIDAEIGYDRWMQDWGEFVGFGKNENDELVYGLYYVNRNRQLYEAVKKMAIILDLPFVSSDSKSGSAGNYGGNLESTPDGIIFHGNTMAMKQIEQLKKLSAGSKLVSLATRWLTVGHVDEMFSIIPSNHHSLYPQDFQGNRVNYSFVVADPMMAFEAIANYQGQQTELTSLGASYNIGELKQVIKYYFKEGSLSNCHQQFSTRNCKFIEYNMEVYQKYILPNIEKLKRTTPTINDDFIHVPQLYYKAKGTSFLPGTANMLVIRDHLIIPDPTFDGFRDIIRSQLSKKLNQASKSINFVSDLQYHRLSGEIHCGTNVMREFNQVFSMTKESATWIENSTISANLEANNLQATITIEKQNDYLPKNLKIIAKFNETQLEVPVTFPTNDISDISLNFSNIDWTTALKQKESLNISLVTEINSNEFTTHDFVQIPINLEQEKIVYYINSLLNSSTNYQNNIELLAQNFYIEQAFSSINADDKIVELELTLPFAPKGLDASITATLQGSAPLIEAVNKDHISVAIPFDHISTKATPLTIELSLGPNLIEKKTIVVEMSNKQLIDHYLYLVEQEKEIPQKVDEEIEALLNYSILHSRHSYSIEKMQSELEIEIKAQSYLGNYYDMNQVTVMVEINNQDARTILQKQFSEEKNINFTIGDIDWFNLMDSEESITVNYKLLLGNHELAKDDFRVSTRFKSDHRDLFSFYQNLIEETIKLPPTVDKEKRLEKIRTMLADINFMESKSASKSFNIYKEHPDKTIIGRLITLKENLANSNLDHEFNLMAKKLKPARKNLHQFLFWGPRTDYDRLLNKLISE